MNKNLTLIFCSYQSQYFLEKVLRRFYKKYPIIIVENSCDKSIRDELKSKFKNINFIIPKKNLGVASSYNLAIRKAKSKFVFLNNPDIEISNFAIRKLITCANKIKNFGIISPVYKNERIFRNYEILSSKKEYINKTTKKFNVREVDLIDNSFLISKRIIKKIMFDEKFFLYFEVFDFAKNLKKTGKKLYVAKNIKFNHFGSSSVPIKYSNLVEKTRAFHYNWSKFYFYKKNYNYFFALRKIYPNIFKALKKLLISLIKVDTNNCLIGLIELMGIFASVFCLKSFYRPKN
tara:strand:+ start:2697 stop:3566 length:870 start_codon:yes stop_codon:yes gene_type:complete